MFGPLPLTGLLPLTGPIALTGPLQLTGTGTNGVIEVHTYLFKITLSLTYSNFGILKVKKPK